MRVSELQVGQGHIVERQIEKKIVEHANELGQYNKNCVYNELQQLWDRKDILKKFVNS